MDSQPPMNDINTNNGFEIQITKVPSHLDVDPKLPEEPENFYRSSSINFQDSPSCSPADSQAPILAPWKRHAQNYEEGDQAVSPLSVVNLGQREILGDQDHIAPQFPNPPPPSASYLHGEVNVIQTSETANNTSQFATFPVSPLSAGLKTSGTTPEEQRIAELELKAQIEDRKDLAVKLKVRLAKVVLRGLHFCCSLVVLALVSSTFAIFYATRHLPARNNLPAWDPNTPQWPQITILVIATLSLLLSTYIIYCYWKGGHSRAERVAMHATLFTLLAFVFTITIWSAGIAIMQGSRNNSNGKDLWGWSCKDNTRKNLFQDTVNYTLVCRQQDWVTICAIIEILLELLLIMVYIFAFYRLVYTKRNLRKSLHIRDEARSSLWIAKLKSQREKEGIHDEKTDINTTYNQLNSNTIYIEAEEGRAVPILSAPPLPPFRRAHGGEEPLTPPVMAVVIPAPTYDLPPTPRSVSFQVPPRPNMI